MAAAFPFSAIVGQDEMKLALLIAAVDPKVGGVLAFGDRGAGKSTAVRALAALLPKMKVVAGCRYNCDPERPAEFCDDCRARAAKGALKSGAVPRTFMRGDRTTARMRAMTLCVSIRAPHFHAGRHIGRASFSHLTACFNPRPALSCGATAEKNS